MSEFEIPLTATQVELLTENKALAKLFRALFQPFQENWFTLSREIQHELKASGSPEITHLEFDRISFDNESHQGKFRVVLDVNFTFGCEDLKREKEGETSEWTFTFDQAEKTLTFHGSPFVQSRSTADEF
jgi:hypothetical protein